MKEKHKTTTININKGNNNNKRWVSDKKINKANEKGKWMWFLLPQ